MNDQPISIFFGVENQTMAIGKGYFALIPGLSAAFRVKRCLGADKVTFLALRDRIDTVTPDQYDINMSRRIQMLISDKLRYADSIFDRKPLSGNNFFT